MITERLKQSASVKDILKVGFLDLEENPIQVSLIDKYLFIELERFFLKLTSTHQNSRLKVEITSDTNFDTSPYQDFTIAITSVATIILTDNMADNSVASIEIYNLLDESEQAILCEAMSINLVCGQEIFIDPSYYFGLNVGGKEQKEKWLINLPENSTVQSKMIVP